MGLSLTPPHYPAAAARSPLHRLLVVLSLVRYRFFLFAGLLPYLLGAAWAWAIAGAFDAPLFWSGLGGVVLAVHGLRAEQQLGKRQIVQGANFLQRGHAHLLS